MYSRSGTAVSVAETRLFPSVGFVLKHLRHCLKRFETVGDLLLLCVFDCDHLKHVATFCDVLDLLGFIKKLR